MERSSVPGPSRLVVPGAYATDRLLRLEAAVARARDAERMLYGPALADLKPLLARAIFSLYLDCHDAGVGDEARRILPPPATTATSTSPVLAPALAAAA
jgi:hypothetical protein